MSVIRSKSSFAHYTKERVAQLELYLSNKKSNEALSKTQKFTRENNKIHSSSTCKKQSRNISNAEYSHSSIGYYHPQKSKQFNNTYKVSTTKNHDRSSIQYKSKENIDRKTLSIDKNIVALKKEAITLSCEDCTKVYENGLLKEVGAEPCAYITPHCENAELSLFGKKSVEKMSSCLAEMDKNVDNLPNNLLFIKRHKLLDSYFEQIIQSDQTYGKILRQIKESYLLLVKNKQIGDNPILLSQIDQPKGKNLELETRVDKLVNCTEMQQAKINFLNQKLSDAKTDGIGTSEKTILKAETNALRIENTILRNKVREYEKYCVSSVNAKKTRSFTFSLSQPQDSDFISIENNNKPCNIINRKSIPRLDFSKLE